MKRTLKRGLLFVFLVTTPCQHASTSSQAREYTLSPDIGVEDAMKQYINKRFYSPDDIVLVGPGNMMARTPHLGFTRLAVYRESYINSASCSGILSIEARVKISQLTIEDADFDYTHFVPKEIHQSGE
jgi:hypothetical protein